MDHLLSRYKRVEGHRAAGTISDWSAYARVTKLDPQIKEQIGPGELGATRSTYIHGHTPHNDTRRGSCGPYPLVPSPEASVQPYRRSCEVNDITLQHTRPAHHGHHSPNLRDDLDPWDDVELERSDQVESKT